MVSQPAVQAFSSGAQVLQVVQKCHVETKEETRRVKGRGEGAGREKRKRLPENIVKMRNTP